MTDEQKHDLALAVYQAKIIAENLYMARATTDNPVLFTMKTDDAHKAFADLAELLGYDVVKK